MITIDVLLVILAVLFFVLAGFQVTAGGKIAFQWFGFACLAMLLAPLA